MTTDIRKLLKDPSLFKEEAFINGKWVKSSSGKTFPINNPATNEIIAQVTNLDATDAEKQLLLPMKPFLSGKVLLVKSAQA